MENSRTENDFTPTSADPPERLLLHACCGPCSLEPLRVLAERGVVPTIHFSNSNIAPRSEYVLRLDAIRAMADEDGVELIEDDYANEEWRQSAGKVGAAQMGTGERRARCRACYRQRLERSAAYAADNGYDALGTTLSVSPYQYGDIIAEELERACNKYGILAFYEDYSPLYGNATRRSRDAGMYRQNYCGCLYSRDEAEAERAERAAVRAEMKAARREERASHEAELEARRIERRAYDAKQAKKRAILKALRENGGADDDR